MRELYLLLPRALRAGISGLRKKIGLPLGDNVAGNVDTLSRWARVRARRVEALTRRVTHIALTRGRTAGTVANDASFTYAADGCGNTTCEDEGVAASVRADVTGAGESACASVCADVVCADENASDNVCVDDGNGFIIEISDDDNMVSAVNITPVNVDVDADAVIVIDGDDVDFCSGSAGFDTANTADSAPVSVQLDTAMMQSPVEPRSVGESGSINQIGGGSGDREVEQKAMPTCGSMSVSDDDAAAAADDDDDDSGEARPPIQVRDIPNFNAFELRQRLDFRDISLNHPGLVPMRIRERLPMTCKLF